MSKTLTREKEILMRNSDISEHFRVLEEDSDVKTTIIELTVEPWYGIQYHYNTVKLQPETGDNELPLQFEYDIDHVPEGVEVAADDLVDFETFLGDVLVAIIVGKENEIRDDDSIESDK
jgi:hypothetical protein